MSRAPVAEKVLEKDEKCHVYFDDFHVLWFVPFDWRDVFKGLRNVQLYRLDERVAQFNCRREFRGQLDHHQVSIFEAGYSPERLAEYWVTAKRFIDDEYHAQPHRVRTASPDTDIVYSHLLVWRGRHDLKALLQICSLRQGGKK